MCIRDRNKLWLHMEKMADRHAEAEKKEKDKKEKEKKAKEKEKDKRGGASM